MILQIELPDSERLHLHIDEAGASDEDDGSGIHPSDFQRFDGPIKREWIKGYMPALDLLDEKRLRVS